MAKAKRNAQIQNPLEARLPEIPSLEALDDEGTGEDPGGRAAGPGAAEEAQPEAQHETPLTLVELVMAKYPGEMVGGRHIATVANHREVVAERRGGEWVLTFEGEQLAKQLVRGD